MLVLSNFIIYFISIYFYKKFWNKYFPKTVPQGVGIILAITISFNILNLGNTIENNNFFIFLLIIILSFAYWIDDLISLSSTLRLIIQLILGIILPILIFDPIFFSNLNFYYFIIILSGIFSIFLTNTINFYDGADLNISVFAVSNLIILFYVFNTHPELLNIILSSIIFFFCFSFFNLKPKNIFFGDAGSFFCSFLIIFFICISILENNLKIIYLLLGLSLPIFDVIYVIILRIYLRESLNTRHFYQIYQLAQKKYSNKFYILIQPLNSILILLSSLILSQFGFNIFYSIILCSFTITIIFYFFVRFFILKDKIRKL